MPSPSAPGTPAYFEDNQKKLAIFIFGLALGLRKTANGRHEEIPAAVWQSPNAALLIIAQDKDRDLVRERFGPIAAHPITVAADEHFTPEAITARFALTPEEIETLRAHYHITERRDPFWKEPITILRFKLLLRRCQPLASPLFAQTGAEAAP